VVFRRNEEYSWAPEFYDHQGPPYLDGFTVQGILDPTTRAAAVEIGDVDMAYVQPTNFLRLQKMAGRKGWLESQKGWGDLSINLTNPILQDLRVRQAIASQSIRKPSTNLLYIRVLERLSTVSLQKGYGDLTQAPRRSSESTTFRMIRIGQGPCWRKLVGRTPVVMASAERMA